MPSNKTYEALSKRYPASEYVVMFEVRDAAGFSANRSADTVVFNLWPSRGLAIEGIEIKSHRGDWLREKKNPKKAESVFQYCDYFWLLTDGEQEVAKLEEIPETWGWMEVKGSKIITKKWAPKLQPVPLTRGIVASMLRRADSKDGYIHTSKIEARIEEARESAKLTIRRQREDVEKELQELQDRVLEFEKAAGIDLGMRRWHWKSPTDIGRAIRYLLEYGPEKIKQEFVDLEGHAKKLHQSINAAVEIFKPADNVGDR